MKLNLNTKISTDKNKVFKEMDGKFYILDEIGDHLITLNETGSEIWQFIEKEKTVKQIVTHLSKIYKTNEDFYPDVVNFIESISTYNLLKIKE